MKFEKNSVHDAFVQRLQNVDPVHIQTVDGDGNPQPWITVNGSEYIEQLVFNQMYRGVDSDMVAAQIAHWGRLAAQCARVKQIHERRYRVWKAKKTLELHEKAAAEKTKRPTVAEVEAAYRTDPEYTAYSDAIEQAEEARATCEVLYDAFRAKQRAMEESRFNS